MDFYATGLSDLNQYKGPYNQVFLLTYKTLPEKLAGIYQPVGNRLNKRFVEKGTTYYGLRLYALPDILTLEKYVKRQ